MIRRFERAARAALRDIVDAASRRFDSRPLHRASIAAREELGPDDPGTDVDIVPPTVTKPEHRGWPPGTLAWDEWCRLTRAQKRDLCEVWVDDPGTDVDIVPLDYSTRERGWMQTVTGRRFYPLAPRAEDVDIYDIAHGLAMCCRYAGHTRRFYSVAEHCVHVSRQVERALTERVDGRAKVSNLTVLRWSLLALLHDSSEAYIGDMIRPLKHQPEMAEFRAAEAAIENIVLRALAPDEPHKLEAWRLIKSIDDRIIVDEVNALKVDPSMYEDITGGALGVRLECWAPEHARARFLHRYEGLTAAIRAEDTAE